MHPDSSRSAASPSTSPDATTSTGQLLDIEPGPPTRAWHADTPPVCPECGCDHSYPVWADRDALRSLYAERDRALARIERLRRFSEATVTYVALLQSGMTPSNPKYWPYTDAYRNALADLQPGDLDAAPSGEGGTDGQ